MGQHMLTIHGYKVYCEDDLSFWGVRYLAYKMGEEDVVAMFHQVQDQRELDFEDDQHRKFTLVKGENDSFTVVTHNKPSGWL